MYPDIAILGDVHSDGDFSAGSDRVQYQLSINNAKGPYTISVQLLYQAIGYRWAENITQYNSTENQRFAEFYKQIPNLPILISEASIIIRQ
jgi:hypothetical protein